MNWFIDLRFTSIAVPPSLARTSIFIWLNDRMFFYSPFHINDIFFLSRPPNRFFPIDQIECNNSLNLSSEINLIYSLKHNQLTESFFSSGRTKRCNVNQPTLVNEQLSAASSRSTNKVERRSSSSSFLLSLARAVSRDSHESSMFAELSRELSFCSLSSKKSSFDGIFNHW